VPDHIGLRLEKKCRAEVRGRCVEVYEKSCMRIRLGRCDTEIMQTYKTGVGSMSLDEDVYGLL